MPRNKINDENMLTSNEDKHSNDDDNDSDDNNIGDNRSSGNNWQRSSSFFSFWTKGNFDGNLSKSFIYK